MAKTKKSKIVQLEVAKLQYAPYQNSRKKSAVAWVRKRRLDVTKLGVIDVSYRKGKYWVVDGMARVLLLKEAGGTHVWAVVNQGLTYEEEAKRFVVLDKERRKTTAFQEFYGEYEARDSRVVSIVELCQKYDYDMLSDAPGKNVVRCYNQIRQIAALPNGLNILDKVFEITRTSWAAFGGTTHGDMFRGLAHFIQHHDVPGVVDRLKDTLLGIHPKTIHAEAYLRRGGNSGSGGHKMLYAILVESYNKEHSPKLASCLRTPLMRKTPDKASSSPKRTKAPSKLPASLGDVFKRDVRGSGFLFRRGGAALLAKRLQGILGDQTAEQFAGAKAASMFRAYARKQRQKLSPQFAELCERWGVEYQDLLLRKKKAQPARRAKKGSNGHGPKKATGEVIFDATSSKSMLDQLDT